MITLEQAREIAEDRLKDGLPAQRHRDVKVFEFDVCYVASAPPSPDPSTNLPSEVGGGCIVIDKETGEVHESPNLGPEGVAERYRRRRRGSTTP